MIPKDIKLIKLKVIKGKEEVFQEWMDFLNKEGHRQEIEEGIREEKVKVESVFSTEEDGETYVYWYMAMDDFDYAMKIATASKRKTDIRHFQFFAECIDPDYKFIAQDRFTIMI